MTFVWTEEAVERLKTLHAEGLSGAELAARLGCGLSRSAIFGKLHRLGLTGKRSPAMQVQRSRLAARGMAASGTAASGFSDYGVAASRIAVNSFSGLPRLNFARKARASRGSAVSGAVSRAPAAALPYEPPPPSLRIGIIEIGADQCRFIAGDDGLACGHPTLDGSSWCKAHRAIVFAPEEA